MGDEREGPTIGRLRTGEGEQSRTALVRRPSATTAPESPTSGARLKEGSTPVEWRYTTCPIDTDAACFGPFRGLVGQWRGRIGADRTLPRRQDLQFEDFAEWLGRIFVAKVEREPFNLRFTLWGVKLVDWWRVDYTNKTLGELSANPDLWRVTEIQYFAAMDRAPFIGLSSGFLSQHGRAHIKVLGLDLPFSDGEGLSHVISAHMKIDVGETIEDVLPDCPIAEFNPER